MVTKVYLPLLFIIVTGLGLNCAMHYPKIISADTLELTLINLTPGDTLEIPAGVYDLSMFNMIPSGRSWEQPIVIKAKEGSKPVIRPTKGGRVLHFGKYKDNSVAHHIEIDGLILDAVNVDSDVIKITDGAHHIRIKNCEIKNSKNQGILIPQKDSNYNEIRNCEIHNNGINDFKHGVYISSNYNVVDSCHIHHNAGCGINIFNGKGTSNYNQVLNCHIHHNATAGNRGTGINLHSGKGHIAKNNIIHDNKNGIQVKYNSVDCIVEDNLLYKNLGYSIVLGNGSTNCIAKNNTIVENKEKRNPEILIGKKAVNPKMSNNTMKDDKLDLDKLIRSRGQ